MKTVLDIPIKKWFDLHQDGCISTFVRLDSTEYEGDNGHCIQSTNPTYDKGENYFIQLDIEVIPV